LIGLSSLYEKPNPEHASDARQLPAQIPDQRRVLQCEACVDKGAIKNIGGIHIMFEN